MARSGCFDLSLALDHPRPGTKRQATEDQGLQALPSFFDLRLASEEPLFVARPGHVPTLKDLKDKLKSNKGRGAGGGALDPPSAHGEKKAPACRSWRRAAEERQSLGSDRDFAAEVPGSPRARKFALATWVVVKISWSPY